MKEVTRVSLNLLSGASFVDSDPEGLDPTWDLDREIRRIDFFSNVSWVNRYGTSNSLVVGIPGEGDDKRRNNTAKSRQAECRVTRASCRREVKEEEVGSKRGLLS